MGLRTLAPRLKWILLPTTLLLWLSVSPAFSQNDSRPGESSPAEGAEPIPLSQIPAQVERTRDLLRTLAERHQADNVLTQAEAALSDIRSRAAELRKETENAIDGKAWWKVLEDLQRNWLAEAGRIQQWLRRLDYHGQELDHDLTILQQQVGRWRATKDAEGSQLGAVLAARVDANIDSLQGEEGRLEQLRQSLLGIQDQLVDLLAGCDRSQEALETASRTSLLGFDSPPLWTALLHRSRGERSPFELQSQRLRAAFDYLAGESHRVAAQGLLFLALLLPALFLSGKVKRTADGDHPARILKRPFSNALLVTLVLIRVFHPGAPQLVYTMAGLLLLVPLLRVVPLAVGRFSRQVYELSLLYVLGILVGFAVENTLFGRLLLLGIAAFALLILSLVVRQALRLLGDGHPWALTLTILSRIVQSLLAFALFINVLGSVSLSGLVVDATLKAVYSGILLWAGYVVLSQGLAVGVESSIGRHLRMVQTHGDALQTTGRRLLALAFAAFWVYYALFAFRLQSLVWRSVTGALTAPLKVGELQFSLGDFLGFAFVVWLSFLISRAIRFFLEEEALPRFSLPQGVPATVSRLTHYVILLLGFLFAITAAGLGLDRITLLTGAFGVGIGFGLQNIVNNLVSGLILLFERPLKIGDQIQIGQFTGRVTSIGFRSSVVRTWEGAEVIVPNGNLISDTVVNWTLSDRLRRADIQIGVAYGTDPRRVLDLLVGVAKQHPDIIDEPAPLAIFVGFSESSLDFSLRAWTDNVDRFITIRSELAVQVNAAIRDAGVEIPFPQRDVHLRGDATPPTPDEKLPDQDPK